MEAKEWVLKKSDAYDKMLAYETVKHITPEVNSTRKFSSYEKKIESRKKMIMCHN